MKAEVYEMFKSINPRIRAYEREKGWVIIIFTCSIEQGEKLEEIIGKTEKETIEIVSKSHETIYFKVSCEDYVFSDQIIDEFFWLIETRNVIMCNYVPCFLFLKVKYIRYI